MEISREAFIKTITMIGAGFLLGNPDISVGKEILVPDHFLWGCSNLKEGIRIFKEKTGVEAVIGGKHPGVGTHNALVSLGDKVYLEIIAPDPEANSLVEDYAFLKELKSPSLFYWAAHTENIDNLLQLITKSGKPNSGINEGSRKKPDGTLLKWKALSLESKQDGLLPFFIQWDKQSKHPAQESPKGCTIDSYWLESPAAVALGKDFTQLGIKMPLQYGKKDVLHLKLNTPKGIVTL